MNLAPATIRVLIPLSLGYMNRARPPYVSSYYYICVRILLYVSPHTPMYVSSYHYMCSHTIYVSSYYYICVLTQIGSALGCIDLAAIPIGAYGADCTTIYVSYGADCTTIYVSSIPIGAYEADCTTIYVSSYYHICVLIRLYNVSHSTLCVLILLYMCPHTTTYVSSYCYMCVLVLLKMCPPPTIYVCPLDEGGFHHFFYHPNHTSRFLCVLILLCVLI